MNSNKIKCVLCGHEAHVITPTHLKKHQLSVVEYRVSFPDAPIFSESFKQSLTERNRIRNNTLLGTSRSDVIKAKISATKKRKYASGETTSWSLGTSKTNEQKQHQSELVKQQFATGGRVHHMLGKHHSESTKAKIAASLQQTRTAAGKSPKAMVPNKQLLREQALSHISHLRAPTPTELENVNNINWLIDQHHTQQKSIQQIAQEYGFWPALVENRCKFHGVEIKDWEK